jgi:hypothetical protein
VDIKPLLEALANLEKACRDAVECLNVLAQKSGAYFGGLEKLRQLFGEDGKGGHREAIRQLNSVVGHCLNVDLPQQTYRIEVIMILYHDPVDGPIVPTYELYIPGSKPYEINAANAVDAFICLLGQSMVSLNNAISHGSDGGIVELIVATKEGRPLVDNAWQRLSDHWDAAMKKLALPAGLDVSGFLDVVSEEIRAAKHLLTFGSSPPTTTGVTPETEHSQPRPKRKGAKQKSYPLEEIILDAHRENQSHELTAEIANVKTPDGRWDTQEVGRVLNRVKQREKRKRSTK